MTTTTQRQMGIYDYLNQGAVWLPKPPAGAVPIAEMDQEWRWNCSQLLIRNAAAHADRYGWGEILRHGSDLFDDVMADMDRWDHERRRDPQVWMRTTGLYRALVTGLPRKRGKLATLADRARHYNACQVRTGGGEHGACTCAAGPGADSAAVDAALIVIREIRAAAKKAERERRETEKVEAQRQALRTWMDANPGLDPDTKRPWGVDEAGVNHSERHRDNEHCRYDSCSGCGGYHCGPCSDDGDDVERWTL